MKRKSVILWLLIAVIAVSACRNQLPPVPAAEQSNEVLPIISIDEKMKSLDDNKGEAAPGIYVREISTTESPETIGSFSVTRVYGEKTAVYGRVTDGKGGQYHHLLIFSEEHEEEIILTDLDRDLLIDDLQLYDNHICLLGHRVQIDAETENKDELELFLMDRTGKLVYHNVLSEVLSLEKKQTGMASLLYAEGELPWIFDYETGKLSCVGEDGMVRKTVQCPFYHIYDIFIYDDRLLFVSAGEDNRLFITESDGDGVIRKRVELNVPDFAKVFTGSDGKLLITDSKKLYSVDPALEHFEEMLVFTTAGIDASVLETVGEDKEGRLFISLSDDGKNKWTLFCLTPAAADDETAAHAEMLTIACLQSSELLRYAVNMYNASDPAFKAVIKEYYDPFQLDSSCEDAEKLLNTDIMDGTAGDVVCFNGIDDAASLQGYIDTSVLENLWDYIREDPEITEADYFTNIWKASERQGVLINLTPLFSLNTYYAKEANLGEIEDVETAALTDPAKLLQIFGKNHLRSDFIHDFCLYIYKHGEKTSDLFEDASAFIPWIEAAAMFSGEDKQDDGTETALFHLDRQLLFGTKTKMRTGMGRFLEVFRGARAFAVSESLTQDELYSQSEEEIIHVYETFGAPVKAVGFPSASQNNSSAKSMISFGILKQSSLKEKAWEFLKYTLGEEYQTGNRVYQKDTIPVNKKVFHDTIELIKTDPDIDPLYFSGIGTGIQEEEIAVFAPIPFLNQEMLDDAEMLIDSIAVLDDTDTEIEKIISEEVDAYSLGQITAETAATRIFQRIRIYYAE